MVKNNFLNQAKTFSCFSLYIMKEQILFFKLKKNCIINVLGLTSLILNQQSKIIYVLKNMRYFNFSNKLSEYPYLEFKF